MEGAGVVEALFEHSLDGIVVTDRDGTIADANPAACALLGRRRPDLVGRRAAALWADASAAEETGARTLAGSRERGPIEIARPDGERRHVELGARARLDGGHDLSILRDVTDRVRAEGERERFERQLASLVARHPVIAFTTDAHGVIVERRGTLRSGDPLEAGMSFGEWFAGGFVLQADGTRYRPDELLAAVVERGETIAGLCSWTRAVYDVCCAPLGEGARVVGMTVLAVDVTGRQRTRVEVERQRNAVERADVARRQAEASARVTARTLEQVVDAAPLGVAVFGADGRPNLWNPMAEEMTGWTLGDVRDSGIATLGEDACAAFVESVRAGDGAAGRHVRCVRRDRAVIDLSWSQAPLVGDEDEAPATLVMFADVTETRRLERQFLEAQKMEAIGRLAGGVAHDFNNMLAAIQGFAGLVLHELPEASPLVEDVREIAGAAERAAALVRQLLTVSRRQPMQVRRVDLRETFRRLDKMLRRVIGEDVELVAVEPDAKLWLHADESQIEQIVLNLAVNARDAMPDGGTLTICLDETTASQPPMPGAEPGEYARLVVRDTGVGMAPELVEQIFEPFFTTKETDKGTGLGLSTVYGIVKRSDGHVFVDSTPGGGTAFTILLPRSGPPDQMLEHAGQDALETAAGAGETVLVVEDDALVRRMMVEVLERRGYRVKAAARASDAQRRFDADPDAIAVLVTDLVMPGGSGAELVERLRARRPELPVLFISAYPDADTPPGDVELLPKPFRPTELLAVVRRILDDVRSG